MWEVGGKQETRKQMKKETPRISNQMDKKDLEKKLYFW